MSESSSSEENVLRPFTLVQFIKAGRQPMQRSVDIVPSDWLD